MRRLKNISTEQTYTVLGWVTFKTKVKNVVKFLIKFEDFLPKIHSSFCGKFYFDYKNKIIMI